MAYNSKHTGEEVEEILDSVEGKQDKLVYYSENKNGSVDVNPISSFVLDSGGNVSITSGIDFEVNVPQGNVIIESKDGVFVNTEDKFEYNGSEVATVDDLPSGNTWNYYLFEGGANQCQVVIDGKNVTIPANTIIEGTFEEDIAGFASGYTNRPKRIIIRGDVSLSLNSDTGTSTIFSDIEEIDMEFSKGFTRSFDYAFYGLNNLKKLRITGGVATSAYYMCTYMGYGLEDGTVVDIKGMDFSQMESNDGVISMFQYAKIANVDLSGHTFNESANYMFDEATVKYANLGGCTFNARSNYMFNKAVVSKVDMSGSHFLGSFSNTFRDATVEEANLRGCTYEDDMGCLCYDSVQVGSIDISGSTFNGDMWSIFYEVPINYVNASGCVFHSMASNMFAKAVVGKADVSGCTFEGRVDCLFFKAEIASVDLSGCDFSGNPNVEDIWYAAKIGSLNVNGVKLPTNTTQNLLFMSSLGEASSIGGIMGSFGEILTTKLNLSSLTLDRQSVVSIFSALAINDSAEQMLLGNVYVKLSSTTYSLLTDSDIVIATNRMWNVEV